jgi:hypothetical protein
MYILDWMLMCYVQLSAFSGCVIIHYNVRCVSESAASPVMRLLSLGIISIFISLGIPFFYSIPSSVLSILFGFQVSRTKLFVSGVDCNSTDF